MSWKKTVLFSAILATLLFGTAELAARLVFSRLEFASRFLDYDETSNRIRWVLVNRVKDSRTGLRSDDVNQDAVRIHRYHPVRGWMTKSHLEQDKTADLPHISTNSQGFRGTEEWPTTKTRFRILLIGDSFTFGDEVSENETYPEYLKRLIPGADIINAGVPGYAHDQMLLLLQDEGARLHPDLVIVGYNNTDIERNGKKFKFSSKPMASFAHGKLAWINVPVPTPQQIMEDEKWHVKLWDILRMIHARQDAQAISNAEYVLSRQILVEMNRSITAMGARSLFIYIPHPAEPVYPERLLWDGWIASLCSEEKIPFYSTLDDMRADVKRGVPIERLERGHFNAAGNESLARGLAGFLSRQHFLPDGLATNHAP